MDGFERLLETGEVLLPNRTTQSKFRVDLYQHERTGLRVVFINAPGPASHSTIVVPTLCQDNFGLPHTLEHLIFCGSKNYPTRGYLEMLATRSLSTGTNAWTASDHTAYTLSTVGFEGLLTTVPVFLDHVINPLLAEKDFVTEVYHIDGSARQQGVVFSEMVSRENTESDLVDLHLRRTLYQNQTTYSYECGGLTPCISQLRNHQIEAYHATYYRLENTTLVLAGQDLPHALLLKALADSPTLTTAPNKSSHVPFTIQFPPPLERYETKVVEFPSDDDTCGSIGYVWRGPRLGDFVTRLALELILFCLTDSPASPLNQAYVAVERPLANGITYHVNLTPETSLGIQFSGVPKGSDDRRQLEPGVFREGLLETLAKITAELSLPPIHDAITRYRVMLLESLEDGAAEDLTQSLVPAIVADRCLALPLQASIGHICTQFRELDELLNLPLEYWKNLVHHWFLSQSPAEVVAVPSCLLGARLETSRAEAQARLADELGHEKLAAIQARLDATVKDCNISISKEVEACLPALPKLSCIPKLEAFTHTLPSVHFERAQVVEVDTQFMHLLLGLPTLHVPEELDLYFVLFQSLLFQLDLDDPDLGLVDYREVVRITNRLTVEHYSCLGLGNRNFTTAWLPELYFVGFKAEPTLWPKALDWVVRNLMFCKFTTHRVLSVARNLVTELEETTRDGVSLACALKSRMLKEGQAYDTRLDAAISIFRQGEFLTNLIPALDSPATAPHVIAQLKRLRDILVGASGGGLLQLGTPLTAHVGREVCKSLEEVDGCWLKRLKAFKPQRPGALRSNSAIASRAPYSFPSKIRYPPCLNLKLGSLTSSYAASLVPCNVFTSGNHADPRDHVTKMAVAVLCELLSRSNGPLFELIRGQGLAYHVELYLNLWSGALIFDLHDSVDPARALLAFWGFLAKLRSLEFWVETVTPLELQLAKSSLVYTSTQYIDSSSALLSSAFKYSLWGFKSGDAYVEHYREYLEHVTLSDLRGVFLKYFGQFLDPSRAQIVVLTPDPTASPLCSTDDEGSPPMDNETIDTPAPKASLASDLLAALADNAYGFCFQDGTMAMFQA
ncbi:hypothetical protein L0F63_004905 [Massospora cicadina]|nr:hypothetical protein L0F63_004905 [Massospora cicadina]